MFLRAWTFASILFHNDEVMNKKGTCSFVHSFKYLAQAGLKPQEF